MDDGAGDIEIGGGNVYADLGRRDAAAMLVKAQLASQIVVGPARRSRESGTATVVLS